MAEPKEPGDKSTPGASDDATSGARDNATVASPPKTYRVLAENGIQWGTRRARYGSKRSDIPVSSVGWLLRGGYIELVDEPADAEDDADA